jgi:hypothetical protein
MNMNEELEALAQRASEVYEAEERHARARQAAQAAEEEAERREWERQAQERFEQARRLLQERFGLPSALCAWIEFNPRDPVRLQLRLPEPFGCAHCSVELHPRGDHLAAQDWYVSCACERVTASVCNRARWIESERLRDLLLYQLEASRRMHTWWQEMETEEAAASAELRRRQEELEASACPRSRETITLYQVHYLRGAVMEAGEVHWLEETGWSRSDQPDAEGYLTLEPTADCAERRILKLDPELHRPVFQKRVFSLTAPNDLPWELTAWQEEQISGFRWQQAHGRSWLVRDPAGSISISFRVPLPWVLSIPSNPSSG